MSYCNPVINPTKISTNCKGFCNISSTTNSSSIYQRQKIIQKTVRVPSSLYSMNLASLNVYQTPESTYNVNWNQMSDRKIPHEQKAVVPRSRSTRHSYTWHYPGYQSPGGKGVDIKHGSYDRYLAKLKGKGPLRRGVIPPIESKLPFSRAFPIYGGKTFKTSIVSGYNCSDCVDNTRENKYIYNNNEPTVFNNYTYKFSVGDNILTYDKSVSDKLLTGVISQILGNNNYVVTLDIDGLQRITNLDSLYIYNKDYASCIVPTCDYSENLTIPNVVTTDYERYVFE